MRPKFVLIAGLAPMAVHAITLVKIQRSAIINRVQIQQRETCIFSVGEDQMTVHTMHVEHGVGSVYSQTSIILHSI